MRLVLSELILGRLDFNALRVEPCISFLTAFGPCFEQGQQRHCPGNQHFGCCRLLSRLGLLGMGGWLNARTWSRNHLSNRLGLRQGTGAVYAHFL